MQVVVSPSIGNVSFPPNFFLHSLHTLLLNRFDVPSTHEYFVLSKIKLSAEKNLSREANSRSAKSRYSLSSITEIIWC
jgi:hypothetical protein